MCDESIKPCILVVDDRPDNQKTIRAMLEHLGNFCTIGAATAGEVITALDERCGRGAACPDLIILDVDLPDVRGGVLGKWIRQVYPYIPFIFVTGYGKLPAFTDAAKELGAPFESKPLDPETFIPLVSATLKNYKTRRKVGIRLTVPPVMREQIASVAKARGTGDLT